MVWKATPEKNSFAIFFSPFGRRGLINTISKDSYREKYYLPNLFKCKHIIFLLFLDIKSQEV